MVVFEASELPGRSSSLDWNRVLWNTLLYRPRTIRLDLAGVRFSPLDEAQRNSHTRPTSPGTVGRRRSVSEVQRKHARSFPSVYEKIIAFGAFSWWKNDRISMSYEGRRFDVAFPRLSFEAKANPGNLGWQWVPFANASMHSAPLLINFQSEIGMGLGFHD